MNRKKNCGNCAFYRPHKRSILKGLCIYKSSLTDNYHFVESEGKPCKNHIPIDSIQIDTMNEIENQLQQFLKFKRLYREM